jgi:type I restriction-modification system DNA methylase subunit
MIGKVLGQFFTPTNIKKFIVKDLIKPLLFDNGKNETIFDPAMGTAGFLITSYKYLKK